MAEEEFEEAAPRGRKRKGKRIFTRKRVAWIIFILFIFSLGALFQNQFVEPIIGENIAGKYMLCLTQKQVLDERFIECTAQLDDVNNLHRACEYQLQQCIEKS